MIKKRYFLIFLIISISYGCLDLAEKKQSDRFVTFKITVDKRGFSKDASLKVRMFNENQIIASDSQASCKVSYDAKTRSEKVICPEGVEYKKITPEEYTFKMNEVDNLIIIKSTSVKVGEEYNILLSGLSSDNCNTASAAKREIAESKEIVLDKLNWATTMMACE